jgi:chromosome segregation ATPase
LAEELSKVAAAEDEALKEVARHRQHASTAIAARQAAEIRLDDLQRLLAQHLPTIEDLTLQRDSLKDERDAGRERLQALERQSLSNRQDADQARKSQKAYVRGIEERAHREVDRAQEETKSALAQLKQLVKQTKVFQQRWEAARLGLSEAQHQAATHQASADRGALEVQQIQSKL